MAAKEWSAGLLMYRLGAKGPEFFLVHPGGPFWKKKQAGWWSIPKGLAEAGEDALTAAIREFAEETGISAEGPFTDLGEIRQKSGKRVCAWAFEGDHAGPFQSGTFQMEWPPRSGQMAEFPEVDQWAYFEGAQAREMILPAQIPFLDRLEAVWAG